MGSELEGNDKKVLLQNILIELGFQSDGEFFVFDFGNCLLKGTQIIKFGFGEVFHFFGYYVNPRNAAVLDFQVPMEVESFEQGVAFIAYYLRNHHFSIIPGWLAEGLNWQFHLPWVREQLDYENTPKASVDREWFKLIIDKIINLAETANDDDVTTFSFDGEVLKIICNNKKLFCAASGSAWSDAVSVKTKLLKRLPKRIKRVGDFDIYKWKNKLYVSNYVYELGTS